jgi:tetratricopeptide (TPR) repeat protein
VDQLALAIVERGIRLNLTHDERRRFARPLVHNRAAYEFYLRGLHQHRLQTGDGYLAARALLQRAIAEDPRFALAESALAATYAVTVVDGLERPIDAWPEVSIHVRRALDLDPELPDAYAEDAARLFYFDRDWEAALRSWRRAIEIGRSSPQPDAIFAYAIALWALGRSEDAIAQARAARERDPLSPAFSNTEADLLVKTGRFEEAMRLYTACIDNNPEDPRAQFGLAEAYRRQRRFDDAIRARLRAHELVGDREITTASDPFDGEAGYARLDRLATVAELQRLNARAADREYVSPLDIGRAHARLGNRDRALDFLLAALDERAAGLVFLNVDSSWDTVRTDPQFVRVVQEVGL